MSAKVTWLIVFVLLYWAYCIFWGIRGAQLAKTASDYFISGRKLPMWVFVLAATATSFSGWTFMGHPGLIYRDGFQYAYASFYVITIPFTGVMFLKRQWILGKRFGYVTPGEMLADYFKGDMVRILTVVVALCFSIPYLGLQLAASGKLFNVLSDGMWGVTTGTWVLAAIVALYVGLGGLRSVAYVDTLQCVLLWFGIVAIGFIAYDLVGGWASLNEGLAKVALVEGTKWGRTPGDNYSAYFAIPGVIQFTAGLGLFGVAVALGAQDLFKNLISGILVLVEKRFKVDDWIIVEGIIEGIVERIGFRSTVVRKFDKSLAIIPNFQFAENAVINISETTNWIISWVITLQYNTTVGQLKKIRDEIEKYVTTHEDYKISLGHAVRVDKFSDSSIDMYIRCFTVTDDWDEWLKVKEKLAIEIKQIVEKNNASFAFPSQSIYVEKK